MSLSWATHASNCAESWVKESSSKELESDAGPSYLRKKKKKHINITHISELKTAAADI